MSFSYIIRMVRVIEAVMLIDYLHTYLRVDKLTDGTTDIVCHRNSCAALQKHFEILRAAVWASSGASMAQN